MLTFPAASYSDLERINDMMFMIIDQEHKIVQKTLSKTKLMEAKIVQKTLSKTKLMEASL